MKKITIAIDGYSSCGKSTMARALAAKLGYFFIDSGAMYRSVTLYFMREGIDITNAAQVTNALAAITISFKPSATPFVNDTYLNGENVESIIRTLEVAKQVSKVSALSAVRRFLVKQQQQMGIEKGIVMDGRDIGTVVFPDAELKIFLTAKPEVRAERRVKEMQEKGQEAIYEDVLKNLQERDHIDTTRDDSPLMKAEDACVLDNSYITREEQLALAIEWANQRINQSSM